MWDMWDDFNTAVQAIDVAALDRAGLGDLAGEIGHTRAVLDGLEARMTVGLRRLGASEASAAETLRRRTGCSTREAKHRTRRAEALQKMPNVAGALSSGRLTGEHASALARAAEETSPEAVDRDAGLLVEASSMPADAASSKARDWVRHRQTNDDLERLHQWQRRNRSLLFTAGEGGMIAGIAKFDRVSGAQFQNLVEALADRLYRADGGRDNPHSRTRAQCRHDALLTLVGIEPASPPPLPASASLNGPDGSGVGREPSPDGGVGPDGSGAGREPSLGGSDGSGVGREPSPGGGAGRGGSGAGRESSLNGPGGGEARPSGSGSGVGRESSPGGGAGAGGSGVGREAGNGGGVGPDGSGAGRESSPGGLGGGVGPGGSGAGRESSLGGGVGPGGSGVGREPGLNGPGGGVGPDGSGAARESSPGGGVGSDGSGVGREAGNGRASSSGSGPRSDSEDSTAGSSPGGHRPVLEVAGHGRASPRLSTPRQEFLPDLASCYLPGPGVDRNTISGPGPGVDRNTISGPGAGSGVDRNTISGPGAGPGVDRNTISGPSLGCTCGRGFGPKAQLCVVMDVPYLATNGERGRCEIPGVGAIARSELERLGCDPDIYGILFDQQGLPLYHGRKTRRVSPQQWRVLVARDKGCVICGAHPNWCQAHHVRYWLLGGPTDIDNLVLLCHAHHRWVHDNEITLRHGPKGWFAPTGLPPPGDSSGRSPHSLVLAR